MRGDCPSSSPRSLSEQWHHCSCCLSVTLLNPWWGEQRSDEGDVTERDGKKDALTETAAVSERERRNKGEKASSCGLAELTVNLCRFIFSGACCSLEGGQIYMPLSGLQWSSARGAEDGISRLKGQEGDGGRGFHMESTFKSIICCLIMWPSASRALVERSLPTILMRNTPSIKRGVSF